MKKEKSSIFKLNIKDFIKGALLAALAAIATALLQIVDSGNIMTLFEWITLKPILIVGLTAFVSYLLKNLLTNSEDKHFKSEPK